MEADYDPDEPAIVQPIPAKSSYEVSLSQSEDEEVVLESRPQRPPPPPEFTYGTPEYEEAIRRGRNQG